MTVLLICYGKPLLARLCVSCIFPSRRPNDLKASISLGHIVNQAKPRFSCSCTTKHGVQNPTNLKCSRQRRSGPLSHNRSHHLLPVECSQHRVGGAETQQSTESRSRARAAPKVTIEFIPQRSAGGGGGDRLMFPAHKHSTVRRAPATLARVIGQVSLNQARPPHVSRHELHLVKRVSGHSLTGGLHNLWGGKVKRAWRANRQKGFPIL